MWKHRWSYLHSLVNNYIGVVIMVGRVTACKDPFATCHNPKEKHIKFEIILVSRYKTKIEKMQVTWKVKKDLAYQKKGYLNHYPSPISHISKQCCML